MRRDDRFHEQELGEADLEAVSGGFAFDATIESVKDQYDASRETYRLALRMLWEHAERQSSVVRRITG